MMFSIVIPVYNVAPYLDECLESLRSQTFSDWEAICVDDESSDGSAEILDRSSARDSRIRVFHMSHRGVSAARNFGIEHARGDWIGFIDGDDAVLPDWLKVVRDYAAESVDLIRMRCCPWCGGRMHIPVGPISSVDYIGKREVCDWFWRETILGGWSWLLFFNARVIKDYGLKFPENVSMREDCIFEMDALSCLRHVKQVEFAGYLYRQRPSSVSAGAQLLDDWMVYCRKLTVAWTWSGFENVPCVSRQVFYSFQDLLLHVIDTDRFRLGEAVRMLRQLISLGVIRRGQLPGLQTWCLDMLLRHECTTLVGRGSIFLLTLRVRWRRLKGCILSKVVAHG